jgi:ABC-type antimicrobial peptide transport system permease subunit
MLKSYLKTSGRSLVRHKLFSAINVTGLGISMSVGLLLIAMLSDLFSYDDFHEKKGRTYRVTTADRYADGSGADLASTSMKAGKQIRASVPGVEAVTIFKRSGGDARAGEVTVPLAGLAADDSFFTVFSFPLLAGNPATALKEPNALVLTQKAAGKLFGEGNVLGRTVRYGDHECVVTGVMKDPPKLSLLRFEALLSLATLEAQSTDGDGDVMNWDNIYSTYVYLVLPEKGDPRAVQAGLDRLSATENVQLPKRKITLGLQPMSRIALSRKFANQFEPGVDAVTLWVLGGLAFVVILSACFNYTNLSIARSLRRSREVGIRKVMGATRGQVMGQFIVESVLIAGLALVFSAGLFLLLRAELLSLHAFLGSVFALELSPRLVLYFVALALGVGVAAGFPPALFFSRIHAVRVLKDTSLLRVFRRVNLRKGLIILQYTFSLMFISATVIGYKQYRGFLAYDLGFTTANVLNIRLQGNKGDLLAKELAELPAVAGISKSLLVTNVGSFTGTQARFTKSTDSTHAWQNSVNEHYLPLHGHRFVAGGNFTAGTGKGEESEVIVNERLLSKLRISSQDPHRAIGQMLTVEGKQLVIVGVLKDFHYGTLDHEIAPTLLRYTADAPGGYLNVKIASPNPVATLQSIEKAWKKIDKVHPLEAAFYDDQIEEAYKQFAVMAKVIGFLAFLAVCIASMGLLGMVVFTVETRLKEMGIRKVLGAGEASLVLLLSKGFVLLLVIAAGVALPVTYFFFDVVVLSSFIYHQPIGLTELLLSAGIVMLIALLVIGSQALKAARTNPVHSLRSE